MNRDHIIGAGVGKERAWRERIQQMIAQEMLSKVQRGNLALLANLRRAMPHAHIPELDLNHVPPQPEVLWWPIYNPWAFAVDEALVAAGLRPTTDDMNPEEALRTLLAAHERDVRAEIEREQNMRLSEMAR